VQGQQRAWLAGNAGMAGGLVGGERWNDRGLVAGRCFGAWVALRYCVSDVSVDSLQTSYR
jgi:hypothetical protein